MDEKSAVLPFKTIPIDQAVGTTLSHDMTEIIPGKYKGPAFKRGHQVQPQDLCRLMRMGKNNLYTLDLKENQVHEDDAVFELASALSGPGIIFSSIPHEGKLELRAAYSGLFKVNIDALIEFNMIEDVICASIHNNTCVEKNQCLAATLEEVVILPDNREIITHCIQSYLKKDTDLIITTGGMSVDPDDVTRAGIENSGFDQVHYSAAVLPGAMFLLGYHQTTSIMGLPACGLYHQTTIFDLILPRLMAGERPGQRDLAKLCHGGLCRNCKPCRFPSCPFGKS